jgi:hypothetical protein
MESSSIFDRADVVWIERERDEGFRGGLADMPIFC